MKKTTKVTTPTKKCECDGVDADVKAKEIEWYNTMIESQKQSMKESKYQALVGLAVLVLIGLSIATLTILNIIKATRGL